MKIVWTDYLIYRATLRGFGLPILETIIRHSSETYLDTAALRRVVVGKHGSILVLIPYDIAEDGAIVPVTVHATSRQQIAYRLRTGRIQKCKALD